jgi:hypothetical protein
MFVLEWVITIGLIIVVLNLINISDTLRRMENILERGRDK